MFWSAAADHRLGDAGLKGYGCPIFVKAQQGGFLAATQHRRTNGQALARLAPTGAMWRPGGKDP